MDFTIKKFGRISKSLYKTFVIGGDIGGTNTRLAVAGINSRNQAVVLLSLNYKTREIPVFIDVLNHFLDFLRVEHKIIPKKACFAAAGAIKENSSLIKLTNGKLRINTREIIKNTSLKKIYLINDFEAVAHGLSFLSYKDIKIIQKGSVQKYKTKAVIGAGSGFGKVIMYHNGDVYKTINSEGGHSDFPFQDKEGIKIMLFLKKKLKRKDSIINEDILSGRGIENIYEYFKYKLGTTKITKHIDKEKEKAKLISLNKNKDRICKKTFEYFSKAYAVAARNFALETLPFSGLYIAGGIAAKNSSIFDKSFLKEFNNNPFFSDILRKIPVYLIKDYDVSLYGSVLYAVSNS